MPSFPPSAPASPVWCSASRIPHRASRIPHLGSRHAFTLFELLIVIAIIAILGGLAFPAYQGVTERAKKVQAKNDLTQLANATNAYYTEYGKYPLPSSSQGFGEDFTYSYDGTGSPPNSDLIKILQSDASATADNPRGVVFLSAPVAKSDGSYGVQASKSANAYAYLDPWGRAYSICIDADYNGKVRERGTGNLITYGVITWSMGKNNDWDKSGIASWK